MDSKELRGLYEAYKQVNASQEVDEAVKGESSERRKDLAAERKSGHRPLPAKEGEKYASHKLSQMAYAKRKRMEEELDIFDVVLEFLQAEGFAETLEEAEWMMANMIDEEAIDIILGEDNVNEIFGLGGKSAKDRLANSDYMKKKNKEADEKAIQNLRDMMSKDPERQKRPSRINNEGYQRNPEKGEKEDKKYAPVRGERTPMPPRGDKRREDFEKWYAAQHR